MQFQVPQFETESKIFGPFTIVQFMYLGVILLVCFLLFSALQIWLWFIVTTILLGGGLAFALVKINGRPMSVISVAVFNYLWLPKVLVYQEPAKTIIGLERIQPTVVPGKKLAVPVRPRVPESVIAIPEVAPRPAPFTVLMTPPVPVPTPAIAPQAQRSLLQGLFSRITTSSAPIPRRETSLKKELTERQRYAVIQRATGETEVVKRVDY